MLPSKRVEHLKKPLMDGSPGPTTVEEPLEQIRRTSIDFLSSPQPLDSDYLWGRFGESLRNVIVGPKKGRQERTLEYLTKWESALSESKPMDNPQLLSWWTLLESASYCEMAEYMSPILRPFLFEGFARLMKFGDIYSGLARVHMMTVDDLFETPQHHVARTNRIEFLTSEDGAPWLAQMMERLPANSKDLPIEWQLDLLIPAASTEPIIVGWLD